MVRYIVALGLRERNPPSAAFLWQANDAFNALKTAAPGADAGDGARPDVLSLLPSEVLLGDAPFCDYLRASNLAYTKGPAGVGRARARIGA
jgi:hypothetical protein